VLERLSTQQFLLAFVVLVPYILWALVKVKLSAPCTNTNASSTRPTATTVNKEAWLYEISLREPFLRKAS
jgi:hypothetical protein